MKYYEETRRPVQAAAGRIVFVALAAAGLAGCTTGPAGSSEVLGCIDGGVIDEAARGVPGITVHLIELNRQEVTTSPDSESSYGGGGGFTFLGVPPREEPYTLAASRPGQTEAAIAEVRVKFRDEAMGCGNPRGVVILQLPRPPEDDAFTTFQGFGGHDEFLSPGMPCRSCSWSTELKQHPKQLRVEANWDDAGLGTVVEVKLATDAGDILERYKGEGPALLLVPGDKVPAEARGLRFDVIVHGDPIAPRIDMESVLTIEY